MTDKALAVNQRIARRVSSLRRDRGASLADLAASSGVSRSMISVIERGETSATAVVLEKLARGLGVTLASLFDDPVAPASPLARASEHTPWRDPDSGYVRRNLSPANYPTPLQLVEVSLPPGAKVAYASGPRDGAVHQQVWVVSGQLDLTVGRTHYTLETDDCLAMRLEDAVSFRNHTRKPVRYVVALATASGGRRSA